MSVSKKYGRTYHYPFSPGTTSDDRINNLYWNDVQKIETVIHTEKLKFYAAMFDFPTVPELQAVKPKDELSFREGIMTFASQSSRLDSCDIITQEPCTCEGVVSRNAAEYPVDDFAHHVFKYVRKGH